MAKPILVVTEVSLIVKDGGNDSFRIGDRLIEYDGVSLKGNETRLARAVDAARAKPVVVGKVIREDKFLELLVPAGDLPIRVIVQPQGPVPETPVSEDGCMDSAVPPVTLTEPASHSSKPARIFEDDLNGWHIAAILLISLVMSYAMSETGEEGGDSKAPKAPDEVGAYVICEEFVKDRLKAPATAEFPWITDSRITASSNGQFRVISYVDAQNSFGGQIRTHYDCTVQYASGRWTLKNLSTTP
jgi:hypothetical protein